MRFFPRISILTAALIAFALLVPIAHATDVDGPDCGQQRIDYGDAPELVQAYPGIPGCFPTCTAATGPGTYNIACTPARSTPPGLTGFIRHVTLPNNSTYWLGCAPAGFPPLGIDTDGNGKTNDTGAAFSSCMTSVTVDCVEAAFTLSFGQDECTGDNDAGIATSPSFIPCSPSSFAYEAYLCGTAARTVFLNVLVDWNQDGDWNDNFQCPGGCAYEWAVKNVAVDLLPGCNALVTPTFTSGPNQGQGWLRISLTDQPVPDDYPWNGSAGTANQSFQGGESEDYPVSIGHDDECPPYRDFGDAPEEAQAYPGVIGCFPTCLFASGPGDLEFACPPISTPPGLTGYVMHERIATSPFGFWLGCGDPAGGFPGVDSENNGKMNDTGGAVSICDPNVPIDCVEPAFTLSFGQDECTGDGQDAGVIGPFTFSTCSQETVAFRTFNCKTTVQAYLNILVDWNQDGDWNDNFLCGAQCAYEWAVKNVLIPILPGCQYHVSPAFLSGPNAGSGWMRVTITEVPVNDDFPWNGSAPNAYRAGETEDYPVTIHGGDPCDQAYIDWGDAPEEIPAYSTGVIGRFPTCAFATPPGTQEIECEFPLSTVPGLTGFVRHVATPNDPLKFWLGCAVDGETNGKTSIVPPFGPSACDPAVLVDCAEAAFGMVFGQDECFGDPDAGIAGVQTFGRCSTATVPFRAYNCSAAAITVYLNVLMDWNQDGDWNDNIKCLGNKRCAFEWAVKNKPIVLNPGCGGYLTPEFGVGPKIGPGWMRISLTRDPVPNDYPWNGSAGTPNGIFSGGETEDYPMQVIPSLVDVPESGPRGAIELKPLVPNPSRTFTHVTFVLSKSEDIDLDVFDVSGRKVATLASGILPAGEHRVRWNFRDSAGRPVPVGIYHVVLQAGDRSFIRRAIRLD